LSRPARQGGGAELRSVILRRAAAYLSIVRGCVMEMYELMDACGGWPDVDRWGGASVREWWDEEDDGRDMLTVLRKCGVHGCGKFHPALATPEEIREAVTFEEFETAAQSFVDQKLYGG